MRVFLVGFMGAGKTTVGRLLAQDLGLPFLDLDDEIEEAARRTIPEIFAAEGEAGFRDREHAALREALNRPPAVIATGGGLPTQERNLELLRTAGTVVWLDVPFETLRQRLRSPGTPVRPLFQNTERARELYEARLPAYRQADCRIPVAAEESPASVAARISDGFKGRSCAT